MSTSATVDMSETLNPAAGEIACPYCRGRGHLSHREIFEWLGIQEDELTQQVWRIEELVALAESRWRRERERELIANMGNCD